MIWRVVNGTLNSASASPCVNLFLTSTSLQLVAASTGHLCNMICYSVTAGSIIRVEQFRFGVFLRAFQLVCGFSGAAVWLGRSTRVCRASQKRTGKRMKEELKVCCLGSSCGCLYDSIPSFFSSGCSAKFRPTIWITPLPRPTHPRISIRCARTEVLHVWP